MVSRGDCWFWKPANFKDKNNGAAVYVKTDFPDDAQLFVFCSQIVTEQNNAMFLLVKTIKMKKLTNAYMTGLETIPPY